MFLMSQRNKQYDFLPYKWGPFSFQMYHDLSRLEQTGFITQTDEIVEFTGEEYPQPERHVSSIIEKMAEAFGNFSEIELMDMIYEKHPEYTIFSDYNKKMDYERDERGIVTVGYEGKSIDLFIYDLIKNKVGILIDVRKNAYSMKFGFSKSNLSKYLGNIGIEYIHIPELGIESKDRKGLRNYEDYQILFEKYANQLEDKTANLEKIKSLGNENKIALMCFERSANYCHRGVIADRLRGEGVEVENI